MVLLTFVDYPELYNLTEKEFLNQYLGAKNLPRSVVVPLTLTYVIILITGVIGNIATCLVIIRKPTMQTATNYYLLSLAISDLSLLVLGLPNELSIFWQQYPWLLGVGYCKLRSYVTEMSSYVSVLTIVGFSMERYLAICHPLHLYAMSGLKRPIRFVLVAWLVGILSAIPFAIYTDVNYYEYPIGSENRSDESAFCSMAVLPDYPLYAIVAIAFFIVPMLVIMVLYIRMGLQIHRSTINSLGNAVEGTVHGDLRQIQSRKSVIKMLSAVVVMFFVCWAPFHTQRLLYTYSEDSKLERIVGEWIFFVSGCFYYFSATVNPILYNVMSAKFRRAFKEMFYCSLKRKFTATPVRVTSSLPETTFCQCDSRDDGNQLLQIRSPRYPCSVRCTINHAKEILRTPGRLNGSRNGSSHVTPRSKGHEIYKNGTTQPLIDNRSSDEIVGDYRRPLEASNSTASSNL